MTWSPLACGLITGKYGDGVPECSRAAMKVSGISFNEDNQSPFDRQFEVSGEPRSIIHARLHFAPGEGVPVAEGAGEQRGGPQADG